MANERPLPWFRCYPEKWLGALAEMPPDQGYVYWIVCLRIYEKRGPIADDNEALARRTGFRPSHVARVVDKLCAIGKLTRTADGRLMNPFAEREMAAGEEIATQTAKVRRDAAKIRWQKDKGNQANGHAKAMQTDPELDLEIDKERKKQVPRGARAKPRSGMPEGWSPSQKDADYAGARGIDRGRVPVMAEAFRNHHRAKATLSAEWSANWRTWVNNEIKFAEERRAKAPHTKSIDDIVIGGFFDKRAQR